MLPEAFSARMKRLLGDGFDAFLHAMTEEDAERAFRLNPLKVKNKEDALLALSAFSPEKLSYETDGYLYHGEKIGNTPLHHAGGIYVQDPGAMAAVPAVSVQKDDKVIDFCASPGGKSTQIAARLDGSGVIVSNEYVTSRGAALVSNFERLGIKNGIVTSLDTATLSDFYPETFDLAVVDAPCSGEGMFRKNDLAVTEWNEGNVKMCAERQKTILDNAAKTVAPGGKLLYSTCTFSLEEDEMTVDAFLQRHPDFTLISPNEEVIGVSAPGVSFPGMTMEHPEYCRRFYPHVSKGEGQFFAVFLRDDFGKKQRKISKNSQKTPNALQKKIIDAFFVDALGFVPDGKIVMNNDRVILLPFDFPIPERGVLDMGVTVGDLHGSALVPHHRFYSAYGNDFLRKLSLSDNDVRLSSYLHGEEIDCDLPSGFASVLYRGIPLGGGKVTGGKLKNHYPKGLRRP